MGGRSGRSDEESGHPARSAGYGRRSTVPSRRREIVPVQGERIRSTSGTRPIVRIRAKARMRALGNAFDSTVAEARSVAPFVTTSSTRTMSSGEPSGGVGATSRDATWSSRDGRFPGVDQADFRTADVRIRRGSTAAPMPHDTSPSAMRRGTHRACGSLIGALLGTGTMVAPAGKSEARGEPGSSSASRRTAKSIIRSGGKGPGPSFLMRPTISLDRTEVSPVPRGE